QIAAYRADPVLPVCFKPVGGQELPLYAHVLAVRNRGYRNSRSPEGLMVGHSPHRALSAVVPGRIRPSSRTRPPPPAHLSPPWGNQVRACSFVNNPRSSDIQLGYVKLLGFRSALTQKQALWISDAPSSG